MDTVGFVNPVLKFIVPELRFCPIVILSHCIVFVTPRRKVPVHETFDPDAPSPIVVAINVVVDPVPKLNELATPTVPIPILNADTVHIKLVKLVAVIVVAVDAPIPRLVDALFNVNDPLPVLVIVFVPPLKVTPPSHSSTLPPIVIGLVELLNANMQFNRKFLVLEFVVMTIPEVPIVKVLPSEFIVTLPPGWPIITPAQDSAAPRTVAFAPVTVASHSPISVVVGTVDVAQDEVKFNALVLLAFK